ncbi:MAG TPA: alkaline phosphatase family protein [Acidimicrobiales bacterium]|nr:alkaline phosphatase family protein [Acidimicrobiales bacterium]
MQLRKFAAGAAAAGLLAAAASVAWVSGAAADPGGHGNGQGQGNGQEEGGGQDPAAAVRTATPIKHLVVIFQENVSFDHYFGTYPYAANTDGSQFEAAPDTPSVNSLGNPAEPNAVLRHHNPNSADPRRLSRSQALTCDQGHGYTQEQKAFDEGLMDRFVENTDNEGCSAPEANPKGLVMDYYDGNTVTALWNYAQHFAMNDDSFNTVFGPSTPGALNLVSGQTHGTTSTSKAVDNGTVFGDADPTFDDCSKGTTIAMSGRNVGDMLNDAKITWGWFEGGFRPSSSSGSTAQCGTSHQNIGGGTVTDYIPHHEPFQYYPSTANPHHVPPASPAEIGHDGQANHQYDMSDFFTALSDHDLPAVSYLKAPAYQDGHAGYSDPLDEQQFIVRVINQLEQSAEWKSTAVVINYDDSDGWYDHVMSPIVNVSASKEDALSGNGSCGNGAPLGGYEDRCAYGPRLPMMVISPFARVNFVDHTLTDQSSILRLVEDNWLGGERVEPTSSPGADGLQGSFDNLAGPLDNMFTFRTPPARKLLLDPATGEPQAGG